MAEAEVAVCQIFRYHRRTLELAVVIHSSNNNNNRVINSKAITGDHLKVVVAEPAEAVEAVEVAVE